MKTLVLLSGGLDSSVIAAQAKERGEDLWVLFCIYGQRSREWERCAAWAQWCRLGLAPERFLIHLLPELRGSSLTEGGELVGPPVVVPARNLILISFAANVAAKLGVGRVLIGANAADQEQFPDCREGFFRAVNHTLDMAGVPVELQAPLIRWTKTQIQAEAARLGVTDTWSCYAGGPEPCRTCGACMALEGDL